MDVRSAIEFTNWLVSEKGSIILLNLQGNTCSRSRTKMIQHSAEEKDDTLANTLKDDADNKGFLKCTGIKFEA